jgi:acyl dehydratase
MATPRAAQVTVGDELPGRTLAVDRARLVQYAGASLDRNPIHWDERFARSVGLPDVIAHGMWTMGAAIDVVCAWAGGADRVRSYAAKFTKPVVVPYDGGAKVVVTGRVTKLDLATSLATVELTATSGGDKVLSRALAVVELD